MQIEVEKNDTAIIITPAMQAIDASMAGEFKEFSHKLIRPEYSLYILDMKNLSFIDSTGLGSLISIQKNITEGQRFVLCNILETVFNIIKLTKLDTYFTIRPSVASAMQVQAE